MKLHPVRSHRSDENLQRSDQLAWKIAEVASERVEATDEVADMVINRIIDNAAVATASLTRAPVVAARAQAEAHLVSRTAPGRRSSAAAGSRAPSGRRGPTASPCASSTTTTRSSPRSTRTRATTSPRSSRWPSTPAAAEPTSSRGIVTGYEIQIDLAKAISLHEHKIDHVAHLGPSAAAGIGTLLGLPTETIFQAIGQALHTTTATRQSRKGEISTWKAYAPAFAGKMAVEAVDRAMRGQTSPTPIYEGEDGVIAQLLDGPEGRYEVPLPEQGEARRAILDSYTKEHSAEYQAQAWIDLARRLGHEHPELRDAKNIARAVLHTSHHTHYVIGSGANDPQKYDPKASRETLDHSIPYIFTVALQDGTWHHVDSYAPERAGRPDTIELWNKVTTVEDTEWTRRYHSNDIAEKAFGGRVEIELTDGSRVVEEIAVADAHPLGARPFARPQYLEKFRRLADGVLAPAEIERFLAAAQDLRSLTDLGALTVNGDFPAVTPKGIF